jgi:molybdopterin adenylyltransferase
MGVKAHKKNAPAQIKTAVITVSTTRSIETDKSGQWMAKCLAAEGHTLVLHQVVTDEVKAIRDALAESVQQAKAQVVIITGGTGISPADVTIEAVRPLFDKELSAFGVLFAQLSFKEIDSAAILSRATAGTIGSTICFCIPGSIKACKLACQSLIFPELGHLVKHVQE